MASVHLPFCDLNCTIEHCPMLICVLNMQRQNMAELSMCIDSYKTRGWKISDNVPDPCKDFQYPLLHWACALGKYSMVRWLVKEGFDPNLQTEAGDTALHRAMISLRARFNKQSLRGLDSVVDLLSRNLSLANMKRQTPMLQLAHSLLKKEISVDYFSHWMICCTDAVINISPEKRSAMTDAQDHDGNTVLHLMVKQPGILPSIKRMLYASASLQIRNKWGQTALDIASSNKSDDYIHHLTTVSSVRWPCLASKGDTSLVRTSPRLQVVAPSCQTMDSTQSKSVAIAISLPRKRLLASRDTASANTGTTNASPTDPVTIKRSANAINAEPVTTKRSANAINAEPVTTKRSANAINAEPVTTKRSTNAINAEPVTTKRSANAINAEPVTTKRSTNAINAEPVTTKRSRKGSPHRRVTFDTLETHLRPSQLEEARSNLAETASINVMRSCIKCEVGEDVGVGNEATSRTAESTSYTNDAMYSPDATTSESSGFFEYLKISPGFKKEIVEKLEHDKQQFQAIINQEETIRLVEETELKQLLGEIKHSDETIVALLGQVEKLQSKTTDIQKKVYKLNQNSGDRLEKVTKIKNKLLVCMKTMKELQEDNGKS